MPSRELKSRVVGAFADVAGETDDGGALFDTTGQGQLRRLPLDQAHPLENITVDTEWRRAMVPVLVRRALAQALAGPAPTG